MADEQGQMRIIISAVTASFESAMKRVSLSLKALSTASTSAFRGMGNIAQRTAGMATSLGASMARVSSAMAQNFKAAMDKVASQAVTAAKVAGVAFAGVSTVIAKTGVAYNAQMEQSNIAWGTLLKSQEAGVKMMQDLQTMGKYTPFETEELDSSAKLLKSFGVNAKDILPYLSALGDATSAIGGDGETLNSLSRAIGQIQAKGKLSSEEVNQMAEAGVGVWDILSKQMGKSTAEIMKMAQGGKLLSKDVIPMIIKGMDQYSGAMDKQSKTFNGMISTLKDSYKITAAKLSVPLFEYLKGVLPQVQAQMDKFTAYISENPQKVQAVFNQIGSVVGTVFKFLSSSLSNFYNAVLKPLFDFISNNKEVVTSVFQTFLDLGSRVGSVVGTMLGQLLDQVIKPLFNTLLQNKSGLSSFFQIFLSAAQNIIPIIASGLTGFMNAVIVPLLNYISQNKATITQFFNQFGGVVLSVIKNLNDLLGFLMQTVIVPLLDYLKNNKDVITNVITLGMQLASQAIKALSPILSYLFQNVVVPLLNFLNSNKQAVAEFFGQFGGFIVQALITLSKLMGDLMTSIIIPLLQILIDNKDVIFNALGKGIQLVQTIIQKAIPFLERVIGAVTDFFNSVQSGDGKGKIFSDLGKFISDFVMQSTGILTDIIKLVGALWDLFGDDIQSYIKSAWDFISTAISSALTVIRGIVKLVLGLISGDTKTSTEGLKLIFQGLGSFLLGLFKGWVTSFPQVLWMVIKGVATVITNLGSTILNGLTSLGKSIWNKMSELGKNVVMGLVKGIAGSTGINVKAATDLASSLIGAFSKKMDIHSPSRVFKGLGEYIVQGLGLGIDGEAKTAVSSIQSLASDITGAFNPQLSSGFDLNSSLANLNGKAAASQSIQANKKTVVELQGDLSKLVDTVKVNVANDVSIISSGGLTF
ncbi:tape measure protein [Priestia megaterium]